MNYYKDCSIPVLNFFNFIQEKDFSELLIDNKNQQLSEQKKKILGDAFFDIFSEYSYLTKNTKFFDDIKKEIFLEYTKGKIQFITSILDIYTVSENIEVLELLNDVDIPFNKEKEIEPQVKLAIKKLKALRNNINIKIASQPKENLKTKKHNIEEDALSIETSLNLKYPIDTETCTLKRWSAMINKINSSKNG